MCVYIYIYTHIYRALVSGLKIQASGFATHGLAFRVRGLGSSVSAFGLKSLGLGVEDL